jgi:hypothetical protein
MSPICFHAVISGATAAHIGDSDGSILTKVLINITLTPTIMRILRCGSYIVHVLQ